MKKAIKQPAIAIPVIALFLLMSFAFKPFQKPKGDSNIMCLELTGKIHFSEMPADNTYKIELFEGSEVTKTAYLKAKTTFRFDLKKDNYYTIRISKEGYVTKLISVNTFYKAKTNDDYFFKCHIDTDLIKESEAINMDKDALDFPIAIICYDKSKKQFDNCERYTAEIKKQIYGKTITSR